METFNSEEIEQMYKSSWPIKDEYWPGDTPPTQGYNTWKDIFSALGIPLFSLLRDINRNLSLFLLGHDPTLSTERTKSTNAIEIVSPNYTKWKLAQTQFKTPFKPRRLLKFSYQTLNH